MYKEFKNINFIIHGHAYIDGAVTTDHYFPCGDLRELSAVKEKIGINSNEIILNLKNHGFIIGANTIQDLKRIINANFKARKVGIEVANG
jgi:hypothetical protein